MSSARRPLHEPAHSIRIWDRSFFGTDRASRAPQHHEGALGSNSSEFNADVDLR